MRLYHKDGFGHPEPLLVQQDTRQNNSPVIQLENSHELYDFDIGQYM